MVRSALRDILQICFSKQAVVRNTNPLDSLASLVRDTGLEPARVSSTGPKPAAYAIRLIPHLMVHPTGLEPVFAP